MGGFRADIEGLRAVAVLAVVLYHAGVGAFDGGYVGVDVFFVVSGFLITGLLWDEMRRTGGLSFRSFYARRARRLLPASMLDLPSRGHPGVEPRPGPPLPRVRRLARRRPRARARRSP
ncbi:MAG: acyltransferase, partial [Actinomycetota bacterium]|nr:acyltransferase [Actinomycetota bacterium]